MPIKAVLRLTLAFKVNSFIAVCLLFLQSSSAQAQEIDLSAFLPLETGNYWEYKLQEADPRLATFYTLRVEGDTLINGESHWLTVGNTFDEDKNLLCVLREAIVIGKDTEIISEVFLSREDIQEPYCGGPYFMPTLFNLDSGVTVDSSASQFADIGPERVPIETSVRFSVSIFGPRGLGASISRNHAQDIGMISHYNSTILSNSSIEFTYNLEYAEIGGMIYGQFNVSTDNEPVPSYSADERINVYPNPFRDRIVLDISDQEPQSKLSYHVFDMLGRILSSGPLPPLVKQHPIIVPDGADGSYLLRITDEERVIHEDILIRIH